MTTLLGPYALSATVESPFDIEWDNVAQPPLGVEIENISGLLHQVTVGASQYWLDPWTARYFPVAANSVKVSVQPVGDLSPAAADPLRMLATLYQQGDIPPSLVPRSLSSLALEAGISGVVSLANGSVVGLANGAQVGITGVPSVNVGSPTVGLSAGTNVGVTNPSTSSNTLSLNTANSITPADLGTGADGNVTIAANATLTRDMNYGNLTVNTGVVLTTAGYIIRATGTVTNNGTVDNSATNATSSVASSPGAGASLGAGAAAPVASSSIAGISPVTATIQGGGGGGIAIGTTRPLGGPTVAPPISISSIFSQGSIAGGGSGSSSGNPQNAGAGGGAIAIFCNTLAGNGTFSANGGNANASGTSAGAGGGGGGVVFIVCKSSSTFTGSSSVTGGTGMLGSSGGTVQPGQVGRVIEYVL